MELVEARCLPVILRDDLASRKNGSKIGSAMFGKLATADGL
jgi:hypothetical protein